MEFSRETFIFEENKKIRTMTNAEQFIYQNIITYPSIHPNRFAVLHHIFAVIGNGYEWENGEVVCPHDHDSRLCKDKHSAVKKQQDKLDKKREEVKNKPEIVQKFELKFWEDYVFENCRVILAVDEGVKDMNIGREKIYNLSERYSMLFTFPEDIKKEWAILLIEFYETLMKRKNRKHLSKENLKKLKKIKNKIKKLKKDLEV